MKAPRNCTSLILVLIFLLGCIALDAQPLRRSVAPSGKQTIRLALLLDTSSSMNGLIDQAKSQLWKIVNDLSAAKCSDGQAPEIRIAIYEYGNSSLSQSQGYIRMVSPLSGDLDVISEKLFSLTTNGGDEYCGQVIAKSLNDLQWLSDPMDLNLIFIAGNEPFNQGKVSYAEACGMAKDKKVIVNTIFCGDFNEGLSTEWKRGADLTGGAYMSIEQNKKTVYIPTPYDDQIDAKNEELNKTYVYYGSYGKASSDNQVKQDENSRSFSKENKVERTISKSSKFYSNSRWDAVDAVAENDKALETMKEKDLPKELRGMSLEERRAYIHKKADDRKQIQAAIQSLGKKREAYLATLTVKDPKNAVLEDAMIRAIHKKGEERMIRWN